MEEGSETGIKDLNAKSLILVVIHTKKRKIFLSQQNNDHCIIERAYSLFPVNCSGISQSLMSVS